MIKSKSYYQKAERILQGMVTKNNINKNVRFHYQTLKNLCQICIEGQKQGYLLQPKTN